MARNRGLALSVTVLTCIATITAVSWLSTLIASEQRQRLPSISLRHQERGARSSRCSSKYRWTSFTQLAFLTFLHQEHRIRAPSFQVPVRHPHHCAPRCGKQGNNVLQPSWQGRPRRHSWMPNPRNQWQQGTLTSKSSPVRQGGRPKSRPSLTPSHSSRKQSQRA
jgi:hypothetical protein